jgi:hypothetical protein
MKPCEKGYKQIGEKEKNGKKVPNCVPVKEEVTFTKKYDDDSHLHGKQKNLPDQIQAAIIKKLSEKMLKEDEDLPGLEDTDKEEKPTPEPETKPAPPKDEFEQDPLEFILKKYPSLRETLVTLLTKDYKEYITGIYILAPKPTKFKVVLHNNQFFYLTYMGKTYEATISGKRYYLIGLGDIQRATMALADLLTMGSPKEDLTGPSEALSPAAEEKPAEKSGAEKGGTEKAPGEGEEVELKESSNMKQQTNEAVKAAHIGVGNRFTVTSDMGKFKTGDKVEVTNIESHGNDIKIYLISDSGVKDFIIVDRNDDSIDFDYSLDEDIYGVAGNPEKERGMKAAQPNKMDARLKNAIKAYQEYHKRYQQTPRSDPGKALASKRMVDLALAVKQAYGVDLEKLALKEAKETNKTWAEGYKEGYLEGYKDATSKKSNKFKK